MNAPDDSELRPGTEADYAAIEAAVMETARGRWFLTEYARRNRTADTETLLAAILRLEGKMAPRETVPAAAEARLQHVGRTAERIRDISWRLKRRHGVEDEAADLERLATELLGGVAEDGPPETEQPAEPPAAATAPVEEAPPPQPGEPAPAAPEARRPRLPREIDFSSLSFEDRMALVS